MRSADGSLQPASWEVALARAADRFRQAVASRGGDSIGVFSCSKSTSDMNFLAQKLARTAFGTNNIDSCNRTRHAPSVVGLAAMFGAGGGTSSYAEAEAADVIVMWGSNARNAHPIFFPSGTRQDRDEEI